VEIPHDFARGVSGVYILWSKGEPVYVGMSLGDIRTRILSHKRRGVQFDYVQVVDVGFNESPNESQSLSPWTVWQFPETHKRAIALENYLIKELRPSCNIRDNPNVPYRRKYRSAKQLLIPKHPGC
jgi:hypothetical protein